MKYNKYIAAQNQEREVAYHLHETIILYGKQDGM
jgi:hypothetical protein